MKLAPESIIVHPAVAMFLKSVKQIHLCSACPCPTILEESDGELDLNKLLEKQVEEISSSANAFKDGILEDILLEVKGVQAIHYFDSSIYSSVLLHSPSILFSSFILSSLFPSFFFFRPCGVGKEMLMC